MKKELNSSLIETDKSVTDAEYYHELYSVKHFRTMKKLFKQQLETNMAVTEQILSELKSKKYYSGKNIEIGDVVLYAMLNKGIVSDGVLGIELITLNENEFKLYCVDERANDGKGVPAIKLVKQDYMPTFIENDKLIFEGEFHFEYSKTVMTFDNCPLQKVTFNWCPITPNEIILKFGEYAVMEAYAEKLKQDFLKHITKSIKK
jgi:hypothetical protein